MLRHFFDIEMKVEMEVKDYYSIATKAFFEQDYVIRWIKYTFTLVHCKSIIIYIQQT